MKSGVGLARGREGTGSNRKKTWEEASLCERCDTRLDTVGDDHAFLSRMRLNTVKGDDAKPIEAKTAVKTCAGGPVGCFAP